MAGSIFRQPIAIAPRPGAELAQSEIQWEGLPRWRRGRPRLADRRVVVQRLLPLLPKLPVADNTTVPPLKKVSMPASPPAPPRILPKPPLLAQDNSVSIVYVVSESNGQYYFHDGNRRIPIVPEKPLHQPIVIKDEVPSEDSKSNGNGVQEANHSPEGREEGGERAEGIPDTHDKQDTVTPAIPPEFLSSESMSLSPSRLLHDADGWLDAADHDFSLTSFLGHLEGRPAVDSHLQSLMAESSVDYVAKFADLAAEVTDEPDHAHDEPT